MTAINDRSNSAADQQIDLRHHIVGYVPGAFDMFHVGHLRILQRAAERCDVLIAGVVDDETALAMKGKPPVVSIAERIEIIRAIRVVDEAIIDPSSDKREAWRIRNFDVLFKGSDWAGTAKGKRLERLMAEVGVRVEYLPYTESTSSTMLRRTVVAIAD